MGCGLRSSLPLLPRPPAEHEEEDPERNRSDPERNTDCIGLVFQADSRTSGGNGDGAERPEGLVNLCRLSVDGRFPVAVEISRGEEKRRGVGRDLVCHVVHFGLCDEFCASA